MNTFSEAIRLEDGVLQRLPYHQQRADRTTLHFFGSRIDLNVVREAIPDEARHGLYKCRVVYDEAIRQVEFIPYTPRVVHRVGVVRSDEIDYTFKSTDRSMLNRLLQASGCDDILIVKHGKLTDSFAANLVLESDEGLFTPKECLLGGTQRRFLLDHGVITERSISVEELPRYRTLRFINAMVRLDEAVPVEIASQVEGLGFL